MEQSGSKWAFPSCVPPGNTVIIMGTNERDESYHTRVVGKFALLCFLSLHQYSALYAFTQHPFQE